MATLNGFTIGDFHVRKARPGGEAEYEIVVSDGDVVVRLLSEHGVPVRARDARATGITAAWVDYVPAEDGEPDSIELVYGWDTSPEQEIERVIFEELEDVALPSIRALHDGRED